MFAVNKLFRWLSIKSKLIIAFAGLSVLPIIILSVYGIISTSNRMSHSAIQNLDHDLTLIQENTANLFTDIGQDLQIIQSSFLTPQFKTKLNSNKPPQENLLNNLNNNLLSFANTKRIYFQIKVLDNSGIEITRVESQSPGLSLPNYKSITGQNLNPNPELYYLLLSNGLSEGSITISPAELLDKNKDLVPVIGFIMPIYAGSQKVGILIADVFAKTLFKTLENYNGLNKDEKVILVNQDGNYLYHSDKKKDWNKLLATKEKVNLKNDYPIEAHELLSNDKDVITNASNDIIAHTPLFYNYFYNHHVNISYNFTTPLYLFVAISRSTILATVHKYEIIFSGIVLIFLFISIGLSLLATRHFTNSLSNLNKGAETIASGNYNYRVRVETRDEIEKLADQFNLMAKSLSDHEIEIQQYKTHLENMVNSRTKELFEEKSKLQTILDNLPSAFLVLDKQLNIQTASMALKKITGYSEDSVIGKNCSSLFDESGICVSCICKRAILTNKIEITVNRKIDENNQERYIEHIAIPIEKEGKILSVITDITKRKHLENFLIKTEKLAATGEIAAYVAHEFRNSLTSIKMILQLIAESKNLSRSEKKSLSVALNSSSEMEEIVSKLLNYANPTPLNFQLSGLNKIIDDSIAFVNLNLKKECIKLRKEIEPSIPLLNLDSVHLKEAVINILFNSIYSIQEKKNYHKELNTDSDNEIRISLNKLKLSRTIKDYKLENAVNYRQTAGLTRDDYEIILSSNTECLHLQITDTGMGIAENNLSRIFDPFFTTKSNGTGLGLPMVKRTINSHGGIINVDSKKGVGTTFNIYIPLVFSQNPDSKYI
jgi:PAS domain S-box-containing protein